MTRDFWKAGHPPTLLAAFLYFDIAFMVWVSPSEVAICTPKGPSITHTMKAISKYKNAASSVGVCPDFQKSRVT